MNESFRVLRTNLDMVVEKKPGQAFVSMFTSFNPNAGKTFVIQNVAASMALKNVKVLLIGVDCDSFSTTDFHVVETVDSVVSSTTASDDDNSRLSEHIFIVNDGGSLHSFFEFSVFERFVNDTLHFLTPLN